MGEWKTVRGHGSDAMADILGEALTKIGALPEEASLLDLADAIEFVTRGMLVVELHADVPPPLLGHVGLAELLHSGGTFPTIPNRGQVQCLKEV